jgi:hypothetical protein
MYELSPLKLNWIKIPNHQRNGNRLQFQIFLFGCTWIGSWNLSRAPNPNLCLDGHIMELETFLARQRDGDFRTIRSSWRRNFWRAPVVVRDTVWNLVRFPTGNSVSIQTAELELTHHQFRIPWWNIYIQMRKRSIGRWWWARRQLNQ